jgi:hypothetical protein
MDRKKFSKLSPEERILWSLSYGWFIYENLPESKKRYSKNTGIDGKNT